MIRLRGALAVYGEVWHDEEPRPDGGVDIVLYFQRPTPIGERCEPFLSLTTDLTVEPDALFAAFNKDCRYKVKRADARDGLALDFSTRPAARIEAFCRFFDAFAREKSIGLADRKWLHAVAAADRLVLANARRHGEALVWHAYIVHHRRATLQYSASCFRHRGNDYRSLVGRANRWLHWQGLLRFREMGFERYDWGGLFQDESTPESAGINAFKKSFGGTPVRSYNCTVPVTLRGRLYLPLRDAWRARGAFIPGALRKRWRGAFNS